MRYLTTDQLLKHPCSECGQPVGRRCIAVAGPNKGQVMYVPNKSRPRFHEARYELARAEPQPEKRPIEKPKPRPNPWRSPACLPRKL